MTRLNHPPIGVLPKPGILALLLCAIPVGTLFPASLEVTSDQEIPAETTATYDSISVSNGAVLTIGGGSTIESTGAVSVSGNSAIVFASINNTDPVGGEWLGRGSTMMADSVTIEAGSSINADGQGYHALESDGIYRLGRGPGKQFETALGASHGGLGASLSASLTPPPVYGSMTEPVDLGSSTRGYITFTYGGGAIRLIVANTLTVDGNLSANGFADGASNHNGATGGSLWITTATLEGSGMIQANAAPKSPIPSFGDSGGGRIALYYSDASAFADLANIEALKGGDDNSQNGTVYLLDTDAPGGDLYVNGRVVLSPDKTDFNSIIVAGSGSVEAEGGLALNITDELLIQSGGTFLARSRNNTGRVDGVWMGEGVAIEASTVTIETGALLSADGQGYQSYPVDGYNYQGTGPGRSELSDRGASYGGEGETSFLSVYPRPVYGSLFHPDQLGSSSYGYTSTTYGGGAIRISSDSLSVDGSLTANGLATGTNHNGATGGSIWIHTTQLSGSGIIQANAAPKSAVPGRRNSGGGRIAVYYSDASGFTDLSSIEAVSGGTGDSSEDGTVLIVDVDNGNGDLTVYKRVGILENEDAVFDSVTVLDGALLEIHGGSSLQVNGSMDVQTGGTVVFRSTDLYQEYTGVWQGRGSTLLARNLNVDEGALLTADGQGYLEGPGSQLRQFVNAAASHGGLGTGDVKPTYGSATMPTTPGSGGGAGINGYTAGGGAMRIIVADTIALNGGITADGVAMNSNTGQSGATGGSIWISAGALDGGGFVRADAAPSGPVAANNDSGGGRVAINTIAPLGIPAANVTASGSEAAGDGTVVIEANGPMRWLSEVPAVLHDVEQVHYYAGALAAGQTVRILAGPSALVTSSDPVGIVSLDFGGVPDGAIDLKLQVLNANASVARELVTSHTISNTLEWHSGWITGNEIWAAGTVHVIEDDLLVAGGASVAVAEGAIIKALPGVRVNLLLDGSFIIESSNSNPTIITSWLDDSVGGDTNGDGSSTTPATGDWHGFRLDFASTLTLNDGAEVRHARQQWDGELEGTYHLFGGVVHEIVDDLKILPWSKLIIEDGAIVKMAEDSSINFDRQTVFASMGTAGNPVVITSILDDGFGGDTNGDGGATLPSPGDWKTIQTYGDTDLAENTLFLYGGGTNTFGAIGNKGGTLTIKNSTVVDAFFDGITALGAMRIDNTIVSGADRGFWMAGGFDIDIVNCVFDDNRVAIDKHGAGKVNIANTIISNSLEIGIHQTGGLASDINASNTLFWNPSATVGDLKSIYTTVQGEFDFTPTSNGNLNTDPLFDSTNPYTGLFLTDGSPAIDAGDGTLATETDKKGLPRFDDPANPNTGTPTQSGQYADMGAYEYLDRYTGGPDLTVTRVLPSAFAATPGDLVDVSWTVENRGFEAASNVWQDLIYLSPVPRVTSETIPVKVVQTTASVPFGDGATIDAVAEIQVPGISGFWFVGVTTNYQGKVLEGGDLSNNLKFSSQPVNISIPSLLLDGSANSITFDGLNPAVYRIDSSDPKTFNLSFDLGTVKERLVVYVSNGRVPSLYDHDQRFVLENAAGLDVLLDPGLSTNSHLMLVPESQDLSGQTITITAQAKLLTLSRVTPFSIRAGSPEATTFDITGSGFDGDTAFVLEQGATGFTPVSTQILNSNTARITVVVPAEQGVVSLSASNSTDSATLENALVALDVSEADSTKFSYKISGPELFRAGRETTLRLTVTNISDMDATAPLLYIEGTEAVIRNEFKSVDTGNISVVSGIPAGQGNDPGLNTPLLDENGMLVNNFGLSLDNSGIPDQRLVAEYDLLAINRTFPASIIPAGTSVDFEFKVLPKLTSQTVDLQIHEFLPGTEWHPQNSLERLRPEGISTEAWARILANLETRMEAAAPGKPALAMYMLLLNSADYLSTLGLFENNAARLIGLEIFKAGALGEIARRDYVGPHGRGSRPFLFELFPITDQPGGDVNEIELYHTHAGIPYSASRRQFLYDARRGYFREPKNPFSKIIETPDGYELTEYDNNVFEFSPQGLAVKQTYPSNEEIVYSYNAEGLLASMESNRFGVVAFEYNADGLVTKTTDPEGAVATFTYDAATRTLSTITTSLGRTVQYDFYGEAEGASSYGPRTIGFPSGFELGFEYDAYGNISRVFDSGGGDYEVSFEYGDQLTSRQTDSEGNTSTQYGDQSGFMRRGLTAGGLLFSFDYTKAGALADISIPELAWKHQIQRNSDEDIEKVIDTMGNIRRFSILEDSHRVTSYTDPRGFTSKFSYDPDTLFITRVEHPDLSSEEVLYNSIGQVTGFINARNQQIDQDFDIQGRPTRKAYPDESSVEYTYHLNTLFFESIISDDGQGNTETISIEYNAGKLPTKVTYPNGKFLAYTYDSSGRRTSITSSDGFVQKARYADNGKLEQVLDGDDTPIVSYDFDSINRPSRILRPGGLTTEIRFKDTLGSASIVHKLPDNSEHTRIDYEYNSLGDIVSRTVDAVRETFVHDPLGQLTDATLGDGTEIQFEYDSYQNRISETREGIATPYETNSMNRYTKAGSDSLSYDADGNLLSQTIGGVAWQYEYDVENRLVSAASASDSITYTYDGLGALAARTVNGVTTEYLRDPLQGNRIIAEYTNGLLVANYFWGNTLEARTENGSDLQYYLMDLDGNTLALTDEAGTDLNRYRWGLFGNSISASVTVEQPFQYGGGFGLRTEGSGLVEAGQRFLSPNLGRFLTEDPGYYLFSNPYTYTGNSPVGSVDFNGLERWFSDQAIINGTSYASTAVGVGFEAFQKGVDYSAKHVSKLAVAGVLDPKSASQASGIISGSSKLAQVTPAINVGGIILEGANDIYGPGGIQDKIEAGDPLVGWDITRTTGIASLKLLTMEVPFSGLIIDTGEYLVDEGSKRVANKIFEYKEPPASDVFGEAGLAKGGRNFRRLHDYSRPVGGSKDPNAKETNGVGDNSAIQPGDTIDYTVFFENVPTASLPAQEVIITDILSAQLDWSTLEIREVGFNDEVIPIPAGFSEIRTLGTVSSDPNAVLVEISLDQSSGTLLAVLRSIDAVTGGYPNDPAAGFLPPNDELGSGEGYIKFRIKARDTLSNGSIISNLAEIVFDANDPIITNVATNVIDTAPPQSSVTGLTSPAYAAFSIEWSGDDNGGAGVRSYDIFVREDGGTWTLWLDDVPTTTWVYNGALGTTYDFYSVATDALGFEELKSPAPEFSVTPAVDGTSFDDWQGLNFSAEDLLNPELETTVWGFSADPDKDGFVNGLEFYTGGDPHHQEDGLIYFAQLTETTATLRILRAPGIEGVTAIAEVSADLADWNTKYTQLTPVDIDGEIWQQVVVALPASGQAFIRFAIIRN